MYPEITTFAKLWEKLSAYSDFFMFDETTGQQYNAIVEPCNQANDEHTFSFSNTDEHGDDLKFSANAQIFNLQETDVHLIFEMADIQGIWHEIWLQVRIKPVLS